MSRRAVREQIAAYLGGDVLDEVSGWYRPTPLAASGLAGVRPYWARQVRDEDYLVGLGEGAQIGALISVHIGRQAESRIALGGPTSGMKTLTYQVELWVLHLARTADVDAAQEHLDDLIEALIARLRADRTLGSDPSDPVIGQAGEGAAGIAVTTGVPVVEAASTIRQEAVTAFEAVTWPLT